MNSGLAHDKRYTDLDGLPDLPLVVVWTTANRFAWAFADPIVPVRVLAQLPVNPVTGRDFRHPAAAPNAAAVSQQPPVARWAAVAVWLLVAATIALLVTVMFNMSPLAWLAAFTAGAISRLLGDRWWTRHRQARAAKAWDAYARMVRPYRDALFVFDIDCARPVARVQAALAQAKQAAAYLGGLGIDCSFESGGLDDGAADALRAHIETYRGQIRDTRERNQMIIRLASANLHVQSEARGRIGEIDRRAQERQVHRERQIGLLEHTAEALEWRARHAPIG